VVRGEWLQGGVRGEGLVGGGLGGEVGERN
jgi:hypothetical protein